MLYAKVVVGLPVDGPFDYSLPPEYAARARPGCRVWVSFGPRKVVGYVVGVGTKASVANVKPLSGLIDDIPLVDESMLEFTRRLSIYFCCSWGEMIEASLPEPLRKGKKIAIPAGGQPLPAHPIAPADGQTLVLADPSGAGRWEVYAGQIREMLAAQRSVIAIFSDKKRAWAAHERLRGACSGIPVDFVFRKKPHEADEWLRIKQASVSVVCGTRSSIFSPSANLGLIIVDEEQDPVHKQEQVPHYHPREAALLRADVTGCRAILCSGVVSLEAYQLVKKKKAQWIAPAAQPEAAAVTLIDMKDIPALNKKQGLVIARTLLDAITAALSRREKALLFFNRKGFATYASCRGCGAVMRCQRCSTALTFHFKENLLKCRYCSFSMPAPAVCPVCNSGYLYYAGAGTEKAESELARLFPQARIEVLDDARNVDLERADIFVTSESGTRHGSVSFNLVGVLAVDAMLNQLDFRAAEHAFGVLTRLRAMCSGQMFIQTNLPDSGCFRALRENDPGFFYAGEMAQRRQLKFPPVRHFIEVRLRGPDEQKVKACAGRLEASFREPDGRGTAAVVSLHPGHPLKLRGNYHWVLLLGAKDPARAAGRIKFILKQTRHSGIIITVNVDPV